MTHLYDVVDHDELLIALNEGYIREQKHPVHEHYRILNYTEKAQFEHKWNRTIKTTRGLIYDSSTLEVLARPFHKIHNWDEPEAPGIDWDAPVYSWSNKFDGSLGILYREPNGRPALATRGSFASEQAIKGTSMLHASGMAWVYDEWIDSGYTPLFEIIYPENRIVLNYGDEEFLAPLGYIHMRTGEYLPPQPQQGANVHKKFRDIVTDLSRENAEGWVVWIGSQKAVKIKQPDYVELHRIVTGLNRKSVWRQIQDGPLKFEEWAAQLPDELYTWALGVQGELNIAFGHRMRQLDALYIDVLESDVWLDETDESGYFRIDRAQFAASAKRIAGKDAGYMFSFLDKRDVIDKVWKELEPRGDER